MALIAPLNCQLKFYQLLSPGAFHRLYDRGFVGPQTDALDGIGGTDYTLMIVFVSVLILTLVIEIRPAIPSHGPDTALITTSFN